jgi:hypothetical protein
VIFAVAQILHVAPWEVEEAPVEWVLRALEAADAEAYAAKEQARRRDTWGDDWD